MKSLPQAISIVMPALIASAVIASPAYAGWNGRLINGSFSTNQTLVTQFMSPAIVSPQVEFTGLMRDVLNDNWTIGVDVSDNFFTISFAGDNNRNVGSSSDLMIISLSGLADASSLTLQDYSCAYAGSFSCTVLEGIPRVASLKATDTTATVSFDFMRDGDIYRFGVTAVPEPATWAMMVFGFGAVGFAVRRRQKVRVSYAA